MTKRTINRVCQIRLFSSTKGQQDQPITLSSDEETGSNSGAIPVDEETDMQVST